MKSLKIALLFLTTITLFACGGGSSGGGTVAPAPAEGTATTKLTIDDPAGNEGGNIIFTVTSNQAIAKQITFTYEATVDNTTTAGEADLSGKLTGTSTIDANTTSTTISIATVNDSLREKAETFIVILSDLSPSDVTFTDYEAIGTISATDATGIVVIRVANAEATEDSGTIKFKVTSAFPATTGSPFTFNYEIAIDDPTDDNSASFDDFTARQVAAATIPADSTNAMISITFATDDTAEPDETFKLLLTNPTSPNATIDSAKNSAKGTILNDDLGEISDATAIIGDGAITLNWTNPDSNLFAGVTIARIAGSAAPAEKCSSGATNDVIENATSNTIIDLTNGIAYSFRICAKSNDGSLSDGVTLANLISGDIDGDGVRQSIDVDDDNDGLIEIFDATGLNNIRYNLAGTSLKTSSSTSIDGNTTGLTGCLNGICRGYELIANINLISFNSGTWDPIGSSSDRFTAIFDGNNNRISGLAIDRASSSDVGLFSTLNNATIRNLKLTDIRITGNDNVGALVGDATGSNTLSNIELIGNANQEASDAEIKGNGANVGGLVGQFSGTISDASSSLTVRGVNNTGGLVGQTDNDTTIDNSWASGEVSSTGNNTTRYGGLVGHNNGAIRNSWASGNVYSNTGHGNGQYGGLAGYNSDGIISNSWASGNLSSNGNVNTHYGGLVGTNTGTIHNSWASGNLSSNGTFNGQYGGLVGENAGSISNSWASGNVSRNINGSNSNYGGLVGWNSLGIISNSWASGEVTGDNRVGGLVGRLNQGGSITQSWASGEVMGNTNVGGLVGINAGSINGRNYQLNSAGANLITSFYLDSTTALAILSGANGSVATTDSNWHAGFDSDNADNDNNITTGIDDITKYCDTNADETIDINEKVATNSVWVMPPATSDNVPAPTTDTAGNLVPSDTYYAIPAIRCIAYTADATNDTEIYRLRKIEIDRQRRLFPIPR